jgi:oligopeptidase B
MLYRPRAPIGLAVAMLLASLLFQSQPRSAQGVHPPVAERKPVTRQHHGITHSDDYDWMRTAKLEDVLARPEALEEPIQAHLDAERRYAHSILAPNRALERQLLAEMKKRVSLRDRSVPEAKGPWEYYARYTALAQRRLYCRRPRRGGAEQVLLDENQLAQGRREFALGEVTISPDHRLLAYSLDEDGSERSMLRVRDLATGRDLADTIPEIRGSVVWSSDAQWLFYVRRDPSKWARVAYRHKIGTPPADDRLLYEESEEGFALSLSATLSDRFLLIESGDFSTSEIRLLDLGDPLGTPREVTGRQAGNKYQVSDLGDRLIIASNAEGALDWQIGERPQAAPKSASLHHIVPHVAGRVIEDIVVYAEYLAWSERERDSGSQRIRLRRWADGKEREIAFGTAPAKIELMAGMEQNTRTLRYTYQSLAQPKQVFDYDMETGEQRLRKVDEVGGGFDPSGYVTRRIEAPAKDGASIPVTLFYRADTLLDGTAPVWLYGYGAYGDTVSPEFGSERLSLVDRGFIYAIAHVRGGGEKGENWHNAGRLANKANSFSDFIAVAEQLVALKLTRPGRIVASGASAGGLLVGAVANLRPELFAGIYSEVPFVDALNTLLDRSLPLTESSFSEFGNPIDSAADFRNLSAYAPYENVRQQAYPPMLIVQSVNDSRVPYWEAAKWVAKLRQMKSDTNPIVLFIKQRGGHSGGSGRFESLEDFARAYAFALRLFR